VVSGIARLEFDRLAGVYERGGKPAVAELDQRQLPKQERALR